MKTTHSIATISLLLFAVACGHEEPPKTAYNEPPAPAPAAKEPTSTGELPAQPTTAAQSTPVAGPTSAGVPHEGPSAGNPEAQPASTLTDGQILEVVHAANAAEIEQAHLALRRSKNAHVRQYAEMMVRDHTQSENKGMIVAKKANLKRDASGMSETLTGSADGTTRTLDTESPTDFDKDYVDAQVQEHQTVLDTIDQKLLDNAQDGNVKAYLINVRAAVAAHLQHAEDLKKELQQP